jgi:hypothetical protein
MFKNPETLEEDIDSAVWKFHEVGEVLKEIHRQLTEEIADIPMTTCATLSVTMTAHEEAIKSLERLIDWRPKTSAGTEPLQVAAN